MLRRQGSSFIKNKPRNAYLSSETLKSIEQFFKSSTTLEQRTILTSDLPLQLKTYGFDEAPHILETLLSICKIYPGSAVGQQAFTRFLAALTRAHQSYFFPYNMAMMFVLLDYEYSGTISNEYLFSLLRKLLPDDSYTDEQIGNYCSAMSKEVTFEQVYTALDALDGYSSKNM